MAAYEALGRKRLMRDIKELVEEPYPNIAFHMRNDSMTSGCLVLSPENRDPLHLTISFPRTYPLMPPRILVNSSIVHPNVLRGGHVCATILRQTDEYTPAYTLKGIAIQMLSFLTSGHVEQEGSPGTSISIDAHVRRMQKMGLYDEDRRHFACKFCSFGFPPRLQRVVPGAVYLETTDAVEKQKRTRRRRYASNVTACSSEGITFGVSQSRIKRLPDEVLLLILENLPAFEQVARFARAWSRVGRLISDYNVVRERELQCFVLKKTYRFEKLGVGVVLNNGQLVSEFDLLSQRAFDQLGIRYSVHNLEFNHWLPLPISWGHWKRVRVDLDGSLNSIKSGLRNSKNTDAVQVLYHFMNDIVVRLNEVAVHVDEDGWDGWRGRKSSLRHASEKAVESYFHLFHLLVCVACDRPEIVSQANAMLQSFAQGKRSKGDCPNLGHLLVALLISDVDMTEGLRQAIITEAITRNVVWLLDRRGANMPELSYLEPSQVSMYRLRNTFHGSLTSYRLLMFSELFRRTARPSTSDPGQIRTTLPQIRQELFSRLGAPPPGCAARLASEIRRLHTVDSFSAFLREMGVQQMPSAAGFTALLRRTVCESVSKGYSQWALPPHKALALRMQAEPDVEVESERLRRWVKENGYKWVGLGRATFFPRKVMAAK